MIEPLLFKVEPNFCIAFWRNVVITNVQGNVDAVGVRGMIGAYHKLFESYPDGIVCVTILRSSLTAGSMDTNAEAKRGMEGLREKIKHVSIVIESEGFMAQLLRTIIRSLNSIARSARLSIAADVEDAARTLAPHIAGAGNRSSAQIQKDLLEAIAKVQESESPSTSQ